MVEELRPEVKARLDALDKEQDPWKIAGVLKEIIPPDKLEEGIGDFDSKYSLHDGVIYKDKAEPDRPLEETRIGTPEEMMEDPYIKEVRHEGFVDAVQYDSFMALRIVVIAEWAKRQGYKPPES